MKKKSQVKMFETIAILVVFFFLVGFGFIFYTKVKQTTSASELEERTILQSIQIAEKASFMPEIQCSFDNSPKDCIDIYKLKAVPDVINTNKVYYYDIFGYSKISIREIYPGTNVWEIYDNPKPNTKGKVSTQFPVSIYDPTASGSCGTLIGPCYYGVLYVDVYR
jgi:hypothetical protein